MEWFWVNWQTTKHIYFHLFVSLFAFVFKSLKCLGRIIAELRVWWLHLLGCEKNPAWTSCLQEVFATWQINNKSMGIIFLKNSASLQNQTIAWWFDLNLQKPSDCLLKAFADSSACPVHCLNFIQSFSTGHSTMVSMPNWMGTR